MKELTIIMPYLNEGIEVSNTINSINNTCGDSVQIIALNDNSNIPSEVQKQENLKHILNPIRIGVNGSIQKGIDMVETPYLMIIDSHMRFPHGWLEIALESIKKEPETAWCCSCMALDNNNMELNKAKDEYTGATMLLIDKNVRPNLPAREVLEPKWIPAKNELEYEVPCILGANYIFSKEWIDYIHGLRGLTMWGTEEPFLSIKTWLAGGKCKINRKIRIGHRFRNNAPYSTAIWTMIYNKMFLCNTILDENLSNKLIENMPKNAPYNVATEKIKRDKDFIEEEMKYYSSIFRRNMYDYCNNFGISIP